MENRFDGGGAAVAICLAIVVVLMLMAGGFGVYFVFARQQAALTVQAELAHQEARMQAEMARAAEMAARAAEMQARSALESARSASSPDELPGEIEAFLSEQQSAWNRGDLAAFMEHYWKSNDLTFSSGGKTTRGWENTLQGYRERYATPEQMGRLTLDDLEISPLGDEAALVLGRWRVERESEPVGGGFTLVLRKFEGRWAIVHDHTSRGE